MRKSYEETIRSITSPPLPRLGLSSSRNNDRQHDFRDSSQCPDIDIHFRLQQFSRPNDHSAGSISLGGMGVKLLFENNVIGTHTHTVESTASATVIPQGQSIQIPKQPVLGGVGGNPYIWLQILDSNNNPLTGTTFLGRCVQGLFTSSADFSIPSTAIAQVSAVDCSNTGSHITLSGQLALSGIKANLIFANSVNLVHENTQSTTVSVVLIPAGQTISFAKQPSLGGVGGNPWIFLQFTDGKGNVVSDSFLLGRCVQLSK